MLHLHLHLQLLLLVLVLRRESRGRGSVLRELALMEVRELVLGLQLGR